MDGTTAQAWVAALHGLTAIVFAVPAYSFFREARSASASASALSSARDIDLVRGPSPADARPGDVVAVRGVVRAEGRDAAGLACLNGSTAALVDSTVETRRWRADEPAWTGGTRTVLSRSWREADSWHLAGSVGETARVERGAVEAAARADEGAVTALVSAGQEFSPPAPPSAWSVLRAVWSGVYEEGPYRLDRALPLGALVTVVAQVQDGIGPSLFLGPIPSVGLFLYSGGVDAVLLSYRVRAGWAGVLSLGLGAVAVWSAAKAVSVRSRIAAPPGPAPQRPSFSPDSPAEVPGEECVACMEKRACAACVPCGHVALCGGCAQRLWGTGSRAVVCPMCRSSVASFVRVFGAPARQ